MARSRLAAHAAGVGGGGLARGVAQVEAVEQFGRPAPALLPVQVEQVGHQPQVLRAGEQPVDGGELAGHADRRADRAWSAATSWPATRAVPASGKSQRGQDVTVVVLPAPLGPSRAKTEAGGYRQVDAVEDQVLAERLAEAGDVDGGMNRFRAC